MKKIRIVVLIALCLACLPALAQRGAEGYHAMPTVDDQLSHLSDTLSLSDTQKSQIRPILQDQHDKMSSLHEDSSLSREDRHAKMMAIHQDASTKIRSLLNDDQLKKFDQMEQQHQHRMGGTH